MKSLLKKSLLAASVAVTFSATAGNITNLQTLEYSQQGLVVSSTPIDVAGVEYEVKAAYAQSDLITITVTEGALDSTFNWPSSLDFTPDTLGANMSLGLLNTNVAGNSATYRVTSVTPDTANTTGTTLDGKISLPTFKIGGASISNGAVVLEISSLAANGVTVVDNTGERKKTLAVAKDQFGNIAVTDSGLDAVIDVAADRKAFVGGSTSTDELTWSTTNMSDLLQAVTTGETVIKLNGNFANLSASDFASAGSADVELDEAESVVTLTYDSLVTTDTITFTPPTGEDAVVLENQEFAISGMFNYGTSETENLGTVDAGEWTLNGAMANIPYMPYGPNASQIIYVTNDGNQDGDIMATVIDDKGGYFDLGKVGVATKNQITKVAPLINDQLRAMGFTGSKASITITVNTKEEDITVYAAYNVGGSDRGFVNTSQYKGK